MKAAVLCVLLLVAGALANQVGQWVELGRADADAMVPLRFALRQQNLDVLTATLLEHSNPKSKNYGQWWSKEEITELVAPAASVSKSVADFLVAAGAQNVEDHRDMVKCQMPVSLVESLLEAQMTEYQHDSKRKHIFRTTKGYTVPAAIRNVVDFVSGMEEFPVLRELKAGTPLEMGSPDVAAKGYITPAHIQEMYGLPSTFTNAESNSIALFEFLNYNSWLGSDLANFVTEMGIPNITVDHIEGIFNDTEPGGESTLDVQYGGAIAISADVWYWTVDGWMYEMTTDLMSASETPLVISMSWGWPEPWQCSGPVPIDGAGCQSLGVSSAGYVDRINVEFQKLGLNGITLVASSGDNGAPGDGNPSCVNNTYPLWSIFPGASPWVLSVGATMLTSVLDAEEDVAAANPPICSEIKCATTNTEGVCTYPDALITTGGGFSSYSARPSYQDAAVQAYLSSGVTLPSSKFYNSSNRGFPDISALGHNYVIALGGSWIPVDGTSCSAPVVAGIITLLNSYRLSNGKSSLGFINQVVYDAWNNNAATFTDITKGNNQCTENCCSKYGYTATKGWDPLTGLGTPQYPALLKYVQTLP